MYKKFVFTINIDKKRNGTANRICFLCRNPIPLISLVVIKICLIPHWCCMFLYMRQLSIFLIAKEIAIMISIHQIMYHMLVLQDIDVSIFHKYLVLSKTFVPIHKICWKDWILYHWSFNRKLNDMYFPVYHTVWQLRWCRW